MVDGSPVKVRIFSDRPIEFKVMWVILVIFLAILAIFLGFKLAEKCPDVTCPEAKECPSCELDCTTCPQKVQYVNVTTEVVKYVCANGNTADNAEDCVKISKTKLVPMTANEVGTAILNVSVKPACVKGYNGGEIYFNLKSLPDTITFQVKDEETEYGAAATISPAISDYKYFVICQEGDYKCPGVDFELAKGKVYLFRAWFNQTRVYGREDYSNEHLIDTTEGSEYFVKSCSPKQ